MSDAIIQFFILFTPNLLNITVIDACVFRIEEFLVAYVFICKDTTLIFIGVAWPSLIREFHSFSGLLGIC
jgi:hypothetical protein